MRTKTILNPILAFAFLAFAACGPSKPAGPETDAATKAAVKDTIIEVLGIEESRFSMSAPIQGDKLGGDALQTAQIIHAAAEACDVKLHDNDISPSGSIPLSFSGDSLARAIAKKKAGGGSAQ